MPKSLFIDPNAVRAKSELKFSKIPMNAYQKSFTEAAKGFSTEDLLGIFHDMQIIREFEGMLYSVRTVKQYNGVEYAYTGPAHLYTGQEAAAVGMAYNLDEDDIIFGSHRSHGEVLAKGYAAIRKMDDDALDGIMKRFHDGALLKSLEPHNKTGSVKDLASDFLLFGFMAELFGRANGFTRGLGNSMHVFFTPFGVYPNNAIVGGSAGIAAGAALFKRVNSKPGMVVCNIGDASLGCGPVWEALNFAAQDQFTKLWDEAYSGGLPIIFNFLNNHYGMGGQTVGETMAYGNLSRVGAGISPSQLHAETIDGYNPFAVIDAFKRKRDIINKRQGPVLLDTLTYRYAGHSPTDASTYRTKEEVEAWQGVDSIKSLKKGLIATGTATGDELSAIEEGIKSRITSILRLAIDESISPFMDLEKDPDSIRKYMFSNKRIERMDDRKPDSIIPKEENSRVQKLKEKARFAFDKDGKAVSKLKQLNIRDALFEAIIDKFYDDPTLIAYGEDNRDWGGAFGVYVGLTESMPYHRFFNSPISEGAIVAAAVGYALCGGRAIPELMYCDFLGRAGDEVFNQMAKWQAMSAGELTMPMVLRVSVGSKYGAQHAQDWTALVAHIPGLKVVYPATPYDAKGLMNAALSGSDPVVFFESQRIYDMGENFYEAGVPEGYYEVAIGEPDVKRVGSDITILTVGPSLYTGIEAAKLLSEKYNMSAEVIDARSLVPFNYEKVIESVKKTGRIVLVSEACERGAHISDFARNITEFCFNYLDGPPVVVATPNIICPSPELEKHFYPQANWILDAINEKILPLPGHTPQMNFTSIEKMRRERMGF